MVSGTSLEFRMAHILGPRATDKALYHCVSILNNQYKGGVLDFYCTVRMPERQAAILCTLTRE